MKTVRLLRRLLVCWVAISVAATGVVPRCEAASAAAARTPRPCCCGCPGECKCGRGCACLTPQPAPAKPTGADKNDPRVKPAEPSVPGVWVCESRETCATAPASPRHVTALTRFPSLRVLEVRIQT
jgi:hypothetical protein